jgi:hypothetical protein
MSNATKKVDLICIGAAKAGTTWLSDCLSQHSQICSPTRKELNYFNECHPYFHQLQNINYEQPEQWYHEHFDHSVGDQLWVDISPLYLPSKGVAERIHAYNPDVKLLAILRNPIEQVYSLYKFSNQRGSIDNMTFFQVINSDTGFVEQAKYFTHLKEYLKKFNRDQLCILLYDDLLKNNYSFIDEIYVFFGIDSFYPKDMDKRSNRTSEAVFPWLNRLFTKLRFYLHHNRKTGLLKIIRLIGLAKMTDYIKYKLNSRQLQNNEKMDTESHQFLIDYYKEEISDLQKHLGRDLTHWLK